MAIAFDAVTDAGRASSTTTQTFAHTTTGTNPIIFVYTRGPNGVSPSDVSYAGVSMSLVASHDNGTDNRLHLYYLVGPSTGSNNVIITYGSSQSFIDSGAATYTGVAQSSPINAYDNTDTTTGTSFDTGVVTAIDNSWVIAAIGNTTGATSAGAGTTQRFANANGNTLADSNAAITPTGTATLQVTRGVSSVFRSVIASFSPFVASSTGPINLTLLGVG